VPSADTFTFLGPEPVLGYMAFRDLDTGTALVASPGQSYRIGAVEEGLPMPPDARWVPSDSEDAKAAVAAAQTAAGILAAQEEEAAQAEAAATAPPGKRKRAGGDTSTPAGDQSTPGGES
jgi:hypothetical protein